MVVAALTGNYGMGKSSVASLFRSCGAFTLDSDAIVAGLLQQRSVIERIATLLGPGVMNADRTLNKSVVADIIFHNKRARKKIEALLHPLVFRAVEASIRKIKPDDGVVLVEVPLLFESGFQKRFDRTIVVYTNQKTALSRLRGKGVSRKDALARLHVQMDIREKKRLADHVIDNNGTRQQAMIQVRRVYKALREEKEH
ncbi:MAG: dephospho-CoA kinase [Nitrospirae bacterium]|nr:dephospho-CoA kinase [Nitrospirota bacterium]